MEDKKSSLIHLTEQFAEAFSIYLQLTFYGKNGVDKLQLIN